MFKSTPDSSELLRVQLQTNGEAMGIEVEFFGIPRSRAGVARTSAEGARLSEVLNDLAVRFPQLAETCFDGTRLRAGYIANLNGERFVTDPATEFDAGDSLLILSADAGG